MNEFSLFKQDATWFTDFFLPYFSFNSVVSETRNTPNLKSNHAVWKYMKHKMHCPQRMKETFCLLCAFLIQFLGKIAQVWKAILELCILGLMIQICLGDDTFYVERMEIVQGILCSKLFWLSRKGNSSMRGKSVNTFCFFGLIGAQV